MQNVCLDSSSISRTVVCALPTPISAETLINQAKEEIAENKPTDAIESLQTVLQIHPHNTDASFLLAGLLRNTVPEKAIQLYRDVIEQAPSHENALLELASLFEYRGALNDASHILLLAAHAHPGRSDIHQNLASVLMRLGKPEDASVHYELALSFGPPNVSLLLDSARTLLFLGRTELARTSLLQCLEFAPSSVEALKIFADIEEKSENIGTAIEHHQRAIQLEPTNLHAWHSKARLLLRLGDRKLARFSYQRVLELQSDHAKARFGLAIIDLLEGQWSEGWKNYEARWQPSPDGVMLRKPGLPYPEWLGEPHSSTDTIVVHHEQGFGDTLQFIRLLPELAKQFLHVVFICQPPLLRLVRANLPNSIEVVTHISFPKAPSSHTHSQPLRSFDWQIPLLSLPLALTFTPTRPTQPTLLHTARAIPSSSPRITHKIGLCWMGTRTHANDAQRSIPIDQFSTLLNTPGVEWHGLVKRAGPVDPRIRDALTGVKDFADTAERLRDLDLVISVDTAVAHLAAGMGKPVWLLNRFAPDWRWGYEGEDSVWYPSLRQFRQPAPGQWGPVLQAIQQALLARISP